MRITQEMWRGAFDIAEKRQTRERAVTGLPAPRSVRLTRETFVEARERIEREREEPGE